MLDSEFKKIFKELEKSKEYTVPAGVEQIEVMKNNLSYIQKWLKGYRNNLFTKR